MNTTYIAIAVCAAVVGAAGIWWRKKRLRAVAHLTKRRGNAAESVPNDSPHGVGFKFLTHNVFLHNFLPAPHKRERLAALADCIESNGYDVVAVQELFSWAVGPWWCGSLPQRFTETLKSRGFGYYTDPHDSRQALGHNSGLALYSKHPIRYARFFPYRATRERLNVKGVIAAELHVSGRRVFFLTTHLDSRSASVQQQQVVELQDIVTAIRRSGRIPESAADTNTHEDLKPLLASPLSAEDEGDEGDVIIVCGDFNVCAKHRHVAVYNALSASLAPLVDVLRLPTLRESVTATHMKGGVLDHVFLGRRNDITVNAEPLPHEWRIVDFVTPDGIYVSDHSGVEVHCWL